MNKIKQTSYIPKGQRTPSWTFTGAWNATLDKVDRFSAFKHDYLWASMLGNSQVDISLALAGVEPSNPFDSRAKRKFDAGVMWEWIAELVAKRAGLFISSQDKVEFQLPGMLKVTGKLDLKLGGVRNLEQMKRMESALEIISFPDRFVKAMQEVERAFNFDTDLPVRVLEVKSSSAFMYDAQYKEGIPSENHALQCLHYLLSTGIEEGAVLYISKDDSRMTEIPVWRDDETLNAKYKEILRLATHYYTTKTKPEIEPLIQFSYDQGRFTDNWNIKYSGYLTMLYGFEVEGDYQDSVKSKVASWNRVFGRVKRGEKMTANNLGYLNEIKAEFPNFDELVTYFRSDDLENHEDGYIVGGEEK